MANLSFCRIVEAGDKDVAADQLHGGDDGCPSAEPHHLAEEGVRELFLKGCVNPAAGARIK